jgi:hypothetical protein
MNAGNKTRGQADGYQLDALSKTVSIKDIDGNVYIPFERNNGGTRLSVDEYGMFFDLFTDGLPRGRLLTIQYLVIDLESEYIVDDKNAKFIVEK